MYRIFRFSQDVLNAGVYHLDKTGDCIETLSKNNAILTCEKISGSISYFILNCKINDKISFGTPTPKGNIAKNEICISPTLDIDQQYLDSCLIADLYANLVYSGTKFPSCTSTLLTYYLTMLIGTKSSNPTQYNTFYDVADIWQNFASVLHYRGEMLNDYIQQPIIDAWLRDILLSYNIEQFEKCLTFNVVVPSLNFFELYKEVKSKIEKTIAIAVSSIGKKTIKDVVYSDNGERVLDFMIPNTPCGICRVYNNFCIDYSFMPSIILYNASGIPSAIISIKEEAEKYESNFIDQNRLC